MHCRRFLDQHALLVDERCSAMEEREMREHMRECDRCARHDAAVRRSLLLVRNLPDIQPSPDLVARLENRLRSGAQPAPLSRPVPFGFYAALASTMAFVALATLGMLRSGARDEIVLEPVVAVAPHAEPPVISAAVVATLPTGMSVWPAILAAAHAPAHFVTAELADER